MGDAWFSKNKLREAVKERIRKSSGTDLLKQTGLGRRKEEFLLFIPLCWSALCKETDPVDSPDLSTPMERDQEDHGSCYCEDSQVSSLQGELAH